MKSPHVSIDHAAVRTKNSNGRGLVESPSGFSLRSEESSVNSPHVEVEERTPTRTPFGRASTPHSVPHRRPAERGGPKGRSRTGRVGPARKAPRHTSPSPNEREARTDRGERDGGPGDGRGDRAHHDQDQAAGARGRALPDSRRRRACPRPMIPPRPLASSLFLPRPQPSFSSFTFAPAWERPRPRLIPALIPRHPHPASNRSTSPC